eukprot:12129-Rhodomonas_salina.1
MIGDPRCARWTRSWCRRPVIGCSSTKLASCPRKDPRRSSHSFVIASFARGPRAPRAGSGGARCAAVAGVRRILFQRLVDREKRRRQGRETVRRGSVRHAGAWAQLMPSVSGTAKRAVRRDRAWNLTGAPAPWQCRTSGLLSVRMQSARLELHLW